MGDLPKITENQPFYYSPPSEKENDSLFGPLTREQRIDFDYLAPLPQNSDIYGGGFELFFGKTMSRAMPSISPIQPEQTVGLPPLKAESVLCALDDVEKRLNELMD